MSDRFSYRLFNQPTTLVQAFPQSASGDSIVYSIYDLTDNATDVNQSSMTFESNSTWSASWTPLQRNFYLIDYHNQTMNVHYFENIAVI